MGTQDIGLDAQRASRRFSCSCMHAHATCAETGGGGRGRTGICDPGKVGDKEGSCKSVNMAKCDTCGRQSSEKGCSRNCSVIVRRWLQKVSHGSKVKGVALHLAPWTSMCSALAHGRQRMLKH